MCSYIPTMQAASFKLAAGWDARQQIEHAQVLKGSADSALPVPAFRLSPPAIDWLCGVILIWL